MDKKKTLNKLKMLYTDVQPMLERGEGEEMENFVKLGNYQIMTLGAKKLIKSERIDRYRDNVDHASGLKIDDWCEVVCFDCRMEHLNIDNRYIVTDKECNEVDLGFNSTTASLVSGYRVKNGVVEKILMGFAGKNFTRNTKSEYANYYGIRVLDRNGNIEKYKVAKINFELMYDDGVNSGPMYTEYKPMIVTYGNSTYMLSVGCKKNYQYTTYGIFELGEEEFGNPDSVSGNMRAGYKYYVNDENCIIVENIQYIGYDNKGEQFSKYVAMVIDANWAMTERFTSDQLRSEERR